MVQISVKSLREDYERAKANNALYDSSFTKGVHITSISKNADGSESIRISKGKKETG